jgi:hypothetical protein
MIAFFSTFIVADFASLAIGVLINKLSPSFVIYGFIMYIAAISIKGIYKKFIKSYKK